MTGAGIEPAARALKVHRGSSTGIHTLHFPQYFPDSPSIGVHNFHQNPAGRVSLRVSTSAAALLCVALPVSGQSVEPNAATIVRTAAVQTALDPTTYAPAAGRA